MKNYFEILVTMSEDLHKRFGKKAYIIPLILGLIAANLADLILFTAFKLMGHSSFTINKWLWAGARAVVGLPILIGLFVKVHEVFIK